MKMPLHKQEEKKNSFEVLCNQGPREEPKPHLL